MLEPRCLWCGSTRTRAQVPGPWHPITGEKNRAGLAPVCRTLCWFNFAFHLGVEEKERRSGFHRKGVNVLNGGLGQRGRLEASDGKCRLLG